MAQHEIVSPLPGTFYRRPSPDAAPFVDVGSTLAPGAVVGIVEVMKQFTEIETAAAAASSRFWSTTASPSTRARC